MLRVDMILDLNQTIVGGAKLYIRSENDPDPDPY